MELPHLKRAKIGNAEFRRRVTPPQMQAAIGTKAVENRNPRKILEAWKAAHARFGEMLSKTAGAAIEQVEWDMLHAVAVAHGLAREA